MKRKPTGAVPKTVSLPDLLVRRGMSRAKEQRRTFSGYIQNLVHQDWESAAKSTKQQEEQAA